jgi:hypothetical protein
MILSSRPKNEVPDLHARLLGALNAILETFEEQTEDGELGLTDLVDRLEEAVITMCIANTELNEMHRRAVEQLVAAAEMQAAISAEVRALAQQMKRLGTIDPADPDFQVALDVLLNGATHKGVLLVDVGDHASIPEQLELIEIREDQLEENFKYALAEYISRRLP